MRWAIDLDGVVWVGEEAVPGSVEAVAELRRRGEAIVFITNNSSKPVQDYVGKLQSMGIEATADEVVTSAQAAASMLEPDTTALVCGGVGVWQALEERGVHTVEEGDADAVVVGWFKEFDYDRLTAAFTAVHNGARLIGTNDDATYPLPGGQLAPGGGSLLAAVAVAAGVEPEVAGKPHQPIVDLVQERVGDVDILIGDRPSTDGLLARRLDARFVLALSGVTEEDDIDQDDPPDDVVADLATLVKQVGDDGDQ